MNVTRQQLFAIIYGGLGILFALVWYSLSLAPVFSVSILAIVLAVCLIFLYESVNMHI